MAKTTFKLEERIRLFVAAYLITFNGVEAARAAGYTGDEATLAVQAHRLLDRPDVQKALHDAIDKRAKKTGVTAERVVLELARVAFSDLTDFGSWDEDGRFTAHPSDVLKKRVTHSLRELKYQKVTIGGGRGSEPVETTTVSFKLHDKLRALELLAKHTGILEFKEPEPEEDSTDPTVVILPDNGRGNGA